MQWSKSNNLLFEFAVFVCELLPKYLFLLLNYVNTFLFIYQVIDIYPLASILDLWLLKSFGASNQHFGWDGIAQTLGGVLCIFNLFLIEIRKDVGCALSFDYFFSCFSVVFLISVDVSVLLEVISIVINVFISAHEFGRACSGAFLPFLTFIPIAYFSTVFFDFIL